MTHLLDNPTDLLKALRRDAENSRRHFVDEHADTLIKETDHIDSILADLLEEDMLTDRQHAFIIQKKTPEEQMKQLFFYTIGLYDDEDKDTFLEILTKHNKELVAKLRKAEDHPPEEGSSLSGASSEGYFFFSSSCHVDGKDCDICGKNHDPADIHVTPNISGKAYRLELRCAGRFCCSETGIKFQVTRPVTIKYELDSWYNYMDNPQLRESEVTGPLFKMMTPIPPDTVSAVYLPHYMCLGKLDGDKSSIKCAHFKDGNLSVETPAQILPFHVVLENPSFSSLGVFCWNLLPNALSRYIPLHGKVLLYFKIAGKKCIEYKIHLYLIPAFAPIDKDFLQEKTSNGYMKIDKPPRTKTIYTKKMYNVNGPETAHVQPTELEVQCVYPLDSYTDITIDAAEKIIDLCLLEEEVQEKVWGCRVSRGEIDELKSQIPRLTEPGGVFALGYSAKQKFVDQHREALISNISLVQPILDSLVTQELLSDEAYDTILSKKTTQDQMRELYRFSRGWDKVQKSNFYDALEKHNCPLIQHLQED